MGTALAQQLATPVRQPEPTTLGAWRRGPKTAPMAVVEFLLGGALFLVVTFGAWRLHLMLPAVAPVYFLFIVLVAIRWGFWEATIASLVSVACLDYLFTEPLYSFRTSTPNWIAMSVFEFTGLVVSRLSTHAQEQARIAWQERNNMARLYELGRSILLLDRHAPAGPQIAAFIQRAFELDSVALFDAATEVTSESGRPAPVQRESTSDCWARDVNRDDAERHAWVRVLRLGPKGIGALGLSGPGLNFLVVDSVASIAAVALERSRALDRETQAEAARQSDQLRTAVLDALAHAFKTPLTAIRAASSGLLETSTLDAREMDLISLIDEQSAHLNDLASRLLRTARLDRADMQVRGERRPAAELIEEVLARFPESLDGHPWIQSIPGFDAPGTDPMVYGNGELIVTALTQVVDNAIKYSDPGSPIRIAAANRAEETWFAVQNMGPVIQPEERERIFERFYRSPGMERRAAGTGLGLSITKKVAEAHHGRVWVTSSAREGTTFYLAFPAGPAVRNQ
jgi:two-component system sensor histidine kinase KdpD